MMFTPEEMARITGGEWIGPPPTRGPACIGHDTRERLDGGAYVAIKGDARDGHDFIQEAGEAGASMAIVKRRMDSPIPCLKVPCTVEAIARLASHWRDVLAGTRVIAITGTAGKTSTKNLLHHVLGSTLTGTASPASWNNAIGGPMSLLRARQGDDYVVLEVGTSSPGEIESLAGIIRPDIAMITLIGHGHLEGLADIDGVRAEKTSLLHHIMPGGLAIVHEDGHAVDVPDGVGLLRHGVSSDSIPRLISRASGILTLDDGSCFEFPVPGPHHAVNAVAAITAARACGMKDSEIHAALAVSLPSDGRGAISTHGGIDFINDAYNANPDSVAAALMMFPELESSGRRVVILGDMLELGDQSTRLHLELQSALMQAHMKSPIGQVLLVGKEMAALQKSLACENLLSAEHWEQLDDQAIREIGDHLTVGDLVLLKGSRGMRLERIPHYIDSIESEAARA